VQKVVRERLSGQNIRLIDPVGYADMVYLMSRAKIVLTDSGGIQEEAPALGKPVLVMRDVTERPEAIETGVAKLVGTDPRLMKAEIDTLLDDSGEYDRRARPVFPYGDGTASRKIADVLVEWSRK
jgi:UDP-N-acetylglucosamine 2-epimerase (non-hydrolysing)